MIRRCRSTENAEEEEEDYVRGFGRKNSEHGSSGRTGSGEIATVQAQAAKRRRRKGFFGKMKDKASAGMAAVGSCRGCQRR